MISMIMGKGEDALIATYSRVVSKVLRSRSTCELQELVVRVLNTLSREEADKVIEIADSTVIGDIQQYMNYNKTSPF